MRRPGADGPVVKHTVKLVKVELFVNPLDHTEFVVALDTLMER